MNKPRLWTKDFIVASLVTLFLSLSFHITLVIISVYAMDTFQSSPSLAGLATGIFVIGGLITRLYFGRWIEKIGRRKMLFAGIFFNLVTILLYFVASSYPLLLIVRFLHGASNGIAVTVAMTIAANIIPNERRGEGMAYFISLSGTLSAAIGPFLAIFVVQHGSYNMVFIFCAIFAVLGLIMAFILSIPEIKLTKEQLRETKEFKFSRFFATKAIPISIICGLIYFCYSSVTTFLSAYSKEINLIEIASFFFIVYSIAVLISRPFVGRLFDSKGENFVIYPAIIIFMAGIILLSQTHSGLTLMLSGALIGIGLGTIQSSIFTIATRVGPLHQTGLATSTVMMLMDVGGGIGPFIYGLFIPFIGYRGMYAGVAFVALVCVFLYYLLYGKEARRGKMGSNQKA
jgi:MFS family permease